MGDAPARSGYVPGIDGLRAVAVLSVLLYHLDHALLPGGFAGVDVFFVISGYVISRSLHASNAATLGAFILGFYQRRILRLLPALVVFLIAASFACALFVPDGWLSAPNNETALWAFFGLSNFYLVHAADGYFSLRVPFNPFLHTWTLGVEEQFYLLFPLLFWLWLKRGARALLPALAAASLLFAAYQTATSPVSAFYLLPSRFWELAAGALLFQYGAASERAWVAPLGVAFLVAGFLYADAAAFPFPWALVPVAGTVLLIAGLGGPMRTWLESRPLTYLGRISYSLYLWHWGVFVLFRWTIGVSELWSAALAVLLTLVLAAVSYHFVELPFRRNGVLQRQPSGRVIAAGVAVLVIAHVSIGLLYEERNALGVNLSVTANGHDWRPYNGPAADPGERQLFVIGDSHAGAYANMVHLAARRVGARAGIFSRFGCPVANLLTPVTDTSPACRHIEEDVLAYLRANARPGDIVFIASLRVAKLGNVVVGAFEREAALADEQKRLAALAEAARFIRQLQAMNLHVLLDAPKPVFRAPPFRCSDWFNRSNPACEGGFDMSREFLLARREPAMASLRELARSQGVHVWDPFPILCPGATCSAFNGKTPVFFDGDHLSGYGGRLLVASFAAELEAIWNGGTKWQVSGSSSGSR
jgi:peptidoglycan/LPS O-acetylase OafA/YrhL